MASVSSLLLYLDWAGTAYGWFAPGPLALLAAAVALTVLFVIVEQRAAEPIIPLRLFQNSVFAIGNLYGFLAGIAMFGAIIFLPFYLQAVMGMSPTESGLAMLPAVFGILTTSIVSGRLITRTGRYKIFPILGAAILIISLLMLSRLEVDTPYWQLALYEIAFGAGLGMTMQTIVTAVQNAVEYRDLGTSTSATAFFRQMGGTIGAAVFGAILANRLALHLTEQLGPAGSRSPGQRRHQHQQSPGDPGTAGTDQDVRADGVHAGARRRLPGRRAGGGAGVRGRALPEGGAAAHHAATITRRSSCRRIGAGRGAQRRLVT